LNAADPRQIDAYTLLARLGASTGGTVYLGESAAGRRVVVKVLPAAMASDPVARAWFAHEVEISRRLVGLFTPEVVGADVEGPLPWMVTRFIEGRSVYGEVATGGPIEAYRVLEVATGTAEALAAVHAAGLVHRDVKPSHVVLARDGAHLLGFAAAAPPGESSLTPDGMIIGTLEYIAPELILGAPSTMAADVFSLGGVLYFAATGESPFGSGDPAVLIHRISTGTPDLGRISDAGLRNLLAVCFDRDPARRPTAAEIVAETADTARVSAPPPMPWPAAIDDQGLPVPFPAALMPDGQAPHHVASRVYATGSDSAGAVAGEGMGTADTYRPPPSAVQRVLTRRRLLLGAGSVVALGTAGAGGYELLRPRPPIPSVTATKSFDAHHSRVMGVGLSSDGARAVTATSSGQLLFWDVAKAAVVGTLWDGEVAYTTMATTADGKLAYVGDGEGVLRIVDVSARKVLHRVTVGDQRIEAVVVAPNGKFVVTATNMDERAVARIWDATSGSAQAAIGAKDAKASRSAESIAISGDSATIATAASLGGVITLWDAATGRQKSTFTDVKQLTPSIAISPDGTTLATTRADTTVVWWNATTHKQTADVTSRNERARRVVYLPSGKGVLVLGDYSAFVQLPDGLAPASLAGAAGLLTGVAITPDSKTAVGGSLDGDARIWDLSDGRNTAILKAVPGGVRSVTFSGNGKVVLSGGDDGVLIGFGTEDSLRALHYEFRFDNNVAAVAMSHDPVRIAVVRNGGAAAANMSRLAMIDPTASKIKPEYPLLSPGKALAFSRDGKLLATGNDSFSGGALIADARSGKQIRALVGQTGDVTGVAFSPDGATLAVSSRNVNARLWNVADGSVRRELVGHTGLVYGVAFAPDGKTVATASQDGTVRLWDAGSGASRLTLVGHIGAVRAVAVSLDSKLVASAGDDGVVRVWTAADGEPLCLLTGHEGVVRSVAFHPKNPTMLASGGQDGTVRLWTVPATKGK